jgi:RNA polymerase sigma-70 factor (ECF subfamily)
MDDMNNNPEFQPDRITQSALRKQLESAIAELPEQCRLIFKMSRFEELKYKEIADNLGISIKTVENQMGKALKILRLKMVDFLTLIMLFYWK